MGNHNGSSGIAVWAVLTGVFTLLYVSFTPPGWRQHRGNSLRVPTHFDFLVATYKKTVTCVKCYYIRYSTLFLAACAVKVLYTSYTTYGKKKSIRDFWKINTLQFFGYWASPGFVFIPGALRHRGELRAAPCPRLLASRFSTLLTERGEGLGKS